MVLGPKFLGREPAKYGQPWCTVLRLDTRWVDNSSYCLLTAAVSHCRMLIVQIHNWDSRGRRRRRCEACGRRATCWLIGTVFSRCSCRIRDRERRSARLVSDGAVSDALSGRAEGIESCARRVYRAHRLPVAAVGRAERWQLAAARPLDRSTAAPPLRHSQCFSSLAMRSYFTLLQYTYKALSILNSNSNSWWLVTALVTYHIAVVRSSQFEFDDSLERPVKAVVSSVD